MIDVNTILQTLSTSFSAILSQILSGSSVSGGGTVTGSAGSGTGTGTAGV